MQNLEVRGGALGIRNRNQQIAAAYGPSVAAKKPKPIPSRVSKASHDKEDYLEKVCGLLFNILLHSRYFYARCYIFRVYVFVLFFMYVGDFCC